MMAELSQATRMTIWEMGITDMQTLLSTSKVDLTKPRGKLVPGQVKEVETWLIANINMKLNEQRLSARSTPLPPVPALVPGQNVASRGVTPELRARRRAWLKGMKGDSTRR